MVPTALENSFAVSYKVKYTSLHDPAIPHLGSYLREIKMCPHKNFTQMFIAALSIIAKKWKHPKVHH